MERGGQHRADITEDGVGENLDRAGLPQDLRHTDRTSHEKKNREIDLADVVLCEHSYAGKCRYKPNAHPDNRRIHMMNEIRRPNRPPHRDPKRGFLLRGRPPSKPDSLPAN